MMIVFQNKIIYMPGLPPNARKETIADYKNQYVFKCVRGSGRRRWFPLSVIFKDSVVLLTFK
jgi:hypothetical protein